MIPVDTSVAHLAGAMAAPLGRDDSPWYPTARLFKTEAGDWSGVIARVRAALAQLAG